MEVKDGCLIITPRYPAELKREAWCSDRSPSSEFRHVSESQGTCLLSTQKK